MERIKFSDINEYTVFYEQTRYTIEFDSPEQAQSQKYAQVFEYLGGTIGVLNFGNYVGTAEFFGKRLKVVSRKVSPEAYDRMLFDITKVMAQLPFDFNTPTGEFIEINDLESSTILYHSYLILRYVILNQESNLQSVCENIFRNPNRKAETEKCVSNVWEAKDVSIQAIESIIRNPQNLVSLGKENSLNNTRLARSIRTRCGRNLFPGEVADMRVIRSFDTPENRFLKYFLKLCVDLVSKFEDKILYGKYVLGKPDLFEECKQISEELGEFLQNPMFEDVGELISIPFNSIVLQKREGYKEILNFYNMLQSSLYMPYTQQKLELIIENKDVAELYELWTYFKIVEIIREILGIAPEKALLAKVNDFAPYVEYDYCMVFEKDAKEIKLWYNKTFTRGKGSYSLTLRPDIVLEIGEERYIFDAKFKLETINWDAPEEERGFTFKNGDIYKMHTYKDAIECVRMACILYPNPKEHEPIFYQQYEDTCFGVGAIPMLPGRELSSLEKFLQEKCFLYYHFIGVKAPPNIELVNRA